MLVFRKILRTYQMEEPVFDTTLLGLKSLEINFEEHANIFMKLPQLFNVTYFFFVFFFLFCFLWRESHLLNYELQRRIQMEVSCEKVWKLLAIYICRKASWQIFNWVLNMLLNFGETIFKRELHFERQKHPFVPKGLTYLTYHISHI